LCALLLVGVVLGGCAGDVSPGTNDAGFALGSPHDGVVWDCQACDDETGMTKGGWRADEPICAETRDYGYRLFSALCEQANGKACVVCKCDETAEKCTSDLDESECISSVNQSCD